MSLLFNMLSGLVIAFLPRNQHLLISWLQSPSAVILEPTFSLSSFTFIKMLFSSLLFAYKGGVIYIFEVIDISPGNLDSSLCFIQPGISRLDGLFISVQ